MVDLVADASDSLDGLAGGVLELPVLVAFAGVDGQASPQPMLMSPSVALAAWSVSGWGSSWDGSMPNKAMAALTAGLI